MGGPFKLVKPPSPWIRHCNSGTWVGGLQLPPLQGCQPSRLILSLKVFNYISKYQGKWSNSQGFLKAILTRKLCTRNERRNNTSYLVIWHRVRAVSPFNSQNEGDSDCKRESQLGPSKNGPKSARKYKSKISKVWTNTCLVVHLCGTTF